MMEPTWWSQPFPPEGAITSEGIRNQLGRPAVDPLTIFVRESAQNSWDARTAGAPVEYGLDVEVVPSTHRAAWRRLLSAGAPRSEHLPLLGSLAADNLRILAVSDRGTKGLGGPIRADVAAPGRRDWISFVLNVGEGRDTVGGGGTYGYGKAVFYGLSRVGTVLVYTRTIFDGRPTTRLIGVALTESFVDVDQRPHTGRHWWGAFCENHVEPLVDDVADEVARELGLPPFRADETGTTIIVVDPDFGDMGDDERVATRLAETIAWQLWPLMLPERGSARLEPTVSCRGIDFEIPDPSTTYPLDLFVRAYRDLGTGQVRTIECQRPKQVLGALALRRRAVTPVEETSAAARNAGVPGDPRHVCLLRTPELVVKYLEGPEPFAAGNAYAGVFRIEDALDAFFAAAEPPTHDDWVIDQMSGHGKTFVRQTRLRILAELKDFVRPATSSGVGSEVPLGAASSYLGSLVAVVGDGGSLFTSPGTTPPRVTTEHESGSRGVTGKSGEGAGAGVSGRGRVGAVRVALVGDPEWQRRHGELLLVQRVSVPRGSGSLRLRGTVGVRTADGSREAEPPTGALQPNVVGWLIGERFVAGNDVEMNTEDHEVSLFVRPAPDAITDIAVTANDGVGR